SGLFEGREALRLCPARARRILAARNQDRSGARRQNPGARRAASGRTRRDRRLSASGTTLLIRRKLRRLTIGPTGSFPRALPFMIKRTVSFALHQPLFFLMMTALFIAGGLMAFKSLPIEAFPDVSDIQVQVITLFPGHAP